MILDTMRSVFIFVLVFTVVFGTSYWYVETEAICPVPVTYKLGQLDERFPITEAEAKKVFTEAEMVWEEPIGRDLFVYDEESDFAINFIYDERQQLASTEEEWRINLDRQEKNSKAAIDKVKAEAANYESLQNTYNKKRAVYEERLDLYNKKVESLNEQGGAPEDVFFKMQAEQKDLIIFTKELETLEEELSDKVDEINKLGEYGNKLIEEYNKDVLKYNEVYGDLDLFTQGDFQRDRINIYKFNNSTELKKVIAHEFGHSLGVGHVEGGESIMYYLMAEQPDSSILSQEDKNEFMATCGTGSEFAHKVRRIIRSTLSYL